MKQVNDKATGTQQKKKPTHRKKEARKKMKKTQQHATYNIRYDDKLFL